MISFRVQSLMHIGPLLLTTRLTTSTLNLEYEQELTSIYVGEDWGAGVGGLLIDNGQGRVRWAGGGGMWGETWILGREYPKKMGEKGRGREEKNGQGWGFYPVGMGGPDPPPLPWPTHTATLCNYPYMPKPKGSLAKPPLNLGHGCIITSHIKWQDVVPQSQLTCFSGKKVLDISTEWNPILDRYFSQLR